MKTEKAFWLAISFLIVFGFVFAPIFSQTATAAATDCRGSTSAALCQSCCANSNQGTGNWNDQDRSCVCSGPTNPPSTNPTGGTVTIEPPFSGGPQNIGELISNITTWVLGIAGAIAVLFIIISGLRYITAHGDSKQAEAAKTGLRNAIVGLVIVVISFFLVQLVVTVLTRQP